MQWASAISGADEYRAAFDEICTSIESQLDGAAPDLIFAFATPAYGPRLARFSSSLRERLGGRVVGCSAGGVIGSGQELEHVSAMAVSAAVLPNVQVHPFHLLDKLVPPSHASTRIWRERLACSVGGDPHFVLFPDPFTCSVDDLLRGLDRAFPDSVKVGGLPSGGSRIGESLMWLDDQVFDEGLVGVMLEGDIAIDTVVAQGCRTIGTPMFVTRTERNVILELDGRRPHDVLDDTFSRLSDSDKRRMQTSLLIGLVTQQREEYSHGDFLIRNIVGLDRNTGSIAVSAFLKPGDVVQFHVRDAESSTEELTSLLKAYRGAESRPPAGALLFSCLGRGLGLFGEADHDSRIFRETIGSTPLAGFFCAGEIGPIQGRTHLHNYTSAFTLFRPKRMH